jgi:hypothetical protein
VEPSPAQFARNERDERRLGNPAPWNRRFTGSLNQAMMGAIMNGIGDGTLLG